MPSATNVFGAANLNNASYDSLYTTPGATKAMLTSLILCNKTATDRTVNVRIVRSGGTPTLQLMISEPVPANSALEVVQAKPIALNTGDQVQAQASAATAIDSIGSVVETT